jgi:hypothetical protein
MAVLSRSAPFATLLAGLLFASGCHRAHYREQADMEAAQLIAEKASHPHWALQRNWIELDPRSRMFNPFDPDFEPMPPDDPAAHDLMHFVDNKRGYPHWDANGFTDTAESPDWYKYLNCDENGVLVIDSDEAYRLALLHSRTYQQQYETLYLSALDVSAERFLFDTQFFGGYGTTGFVSHRSPPSGGDTISRLTNRGDVTARRAFANGADLAATIANTLVWNFDGTDTFTPTTLFSLSFIQPLLRNAGKDRVLERLTLSERDLLANVRQMERYRRAFYVDIMTGRDAGTGATRRGGFFGGSGLEGFAGVGGGGFGGVGGGFGGGGAAIGGGGIGAAQAGGYFGLIQDQQSIRNQRITIAGLRSNLVQLRESLRENLAQIPDNPEALLTERLQITQARQRLLDAESGLLTSQASYHASVDSYKRDLGLPPKLCVTVADDMLDRFNLIPADTLESQNEVTELRDTVGLANEQLLNSAHRIEIDGTPTETLEWSDEVGSSLGILRSMLDRMRGIQERLTAGTLAQVRKDIDELKRVLPERKRDLQALQKVYQQELNRFARYGGLDPCQMTLIADIDPSVFDTEALEALVPVLEAELERLENEFQSFNTPLQEIQNIITGILDAPEKPEAADLFRILDEQVIFRTPSLLADLSADILDLSLVQARARAHIVRVSPIDLPWEMAVQMAERYRRDWMNNRAALVNSWRLIEFNADNLEGFLDFEFDGNIDDRGRRDATVALRFDAPITRLLERNTYRQALIEYQQARRNYFAYRDGVSQSLRNTLRTISVNRINFEQRRIAVISAIEQVVLNDQISKLREERGQAAGVTAARDVVDALGDLQSAQNAFLSVWLNYEVQRINLDLDLGTMNLDMEGYWIDPGPIGDEHGYPAPIGFACDAPTYILGPEDEPELLPEVEGNQGESLPRPEPFGDDPRSARRPRYAQPGWQEVRASDVPPSVEPANFEQLLRLKRLPPVANRRN